MPLPETSERRLSATQEEIHRLLLVEQEHFSLLNALEAANVGLWQWDLRSGELRYDATWMWLLDYQEDEASHIPGGWENLLHADDLTPFHDKLNSFLAGHQAVFCSEQRLRTRNGGWRWMRLQGRIVTDEQASRLVGVMTQTGTNPLPAGAPPNLFFNPLTGLPNRHLFLDRLQGGLLRATRAEHPLALFYIAVEGVRDDSNVALQPVSEAMLQSISRRLQLQLRRSDTLAHYQSQDFVVMMDPLRQRRDSELLANRLLAAVTKPFNDGDNSRQLRCHIGLALFPDHGAQAAQLLARAHAAMQALRQADDAGFG